MDPLTIAGGCLGTVSTIAKLSALTTGLFKTFRSAKKDLETVSGELMAMSICLNKLAGDVGKQAVNLPETVLDVVQGCDSVAKQIYALLLKLSSGELRVRAKWTMSDRGKMEKLRVTMDRHSAAVGIALDMVNF